MDTTDQIAAISDIRDAMTTACDRWRDGNDNGNGYAWDGEPEGARQILHATNDREVDVWKMSDGSEVAVGDAHGPWAVTITRP